MTNLTDMSHAQTAPSDLSLTARLDDWFAADPQALADSANLARELRETAPVYRHRAMTLVSPYALVKDILCDSESFSNDASRHGSRADAAYARLTDDDQRRAFREVMRLESLAMVRNDGDEHRRLRGAAAAAMAPRRIQQVVSAIDRHAAASLAELPDEPVFDLERFTADLPLRVICDLIGVPIEDRARIREWATAMSANRHGTNPQALVPAYHAWLAMQDYVEGLVRRYRDSSDGADQLVTLLMDAHATGRITHDEVLAIFVQLLQAGQDTTSILLTVGIYELLNAPGQWAALVEDPSLIPNTVDELLRVVSPAQVANRVCILPIRIGGTKLAPGDTVLALVSAANRDPAVFPEPDRLDVRRAEARRHLALSFGPHFCLGSSLARAEAAVALRHLTERFPTLRLASTDIRFRGPWQLRRLECLPVTT